MLPLSDTSPMPWSIEIVFAPVIFHERVADSPTAISVGLALKTTMTVCPTDSDPEDGADSPPGVLDGDEGCAGFSMTMQLATMNNKITIDIAVGIE